MARRRWEHLEIRIIIDNQDPVLIQHLARKLRKLKIKNFLNNRIIKFSHIKPKLETQTLDGQAKRTWSALITSFLTLSILTELNLITVSQPIQWAKLEYLQIWRWFKPYNGRRYGMRHLRRWIFEAIQGRSFDFANLPYSAYHHPEELHFWLNKEDLGKWDNYKTTNDIVYDIF